jgi:hypothetical protein
MVGPSSLWEVLPVAVSLSQLVLAAVFAVAGAAKLLDRAETRRAVPWLRRSGALAGAAGRRPSAGRVDHRRCAIRSRAGRWAALAALALLLVFCAVIVRRSRALRRRTATASVG